jgi:hypothetical protein
MSPSKKAQADAAYERQEDQRALVKVLAAAEEFALGFDVVLSLGGADRALAIVEAVARVKAAFLRVEAPVAKPEPGTLPGQLAIDGAVAGAPPIRELGNPMAEVFDVPKQCPRCGENMLLTWGGHWTPMRVFDDKFALQCGLCGACVEATEHQYEAVVAERQRTIGESDKRVERHLHQKRVRGAG